MKKSSFRCRLPLVILAVLLGDSVIGISKTDYLAQYKGTPYHDSRYQGGAQRIPGTILCAYYDLGGEGVAYHDSDVKNNGSGTLNPADGTYLHEFRMSEGVDTSFTKFGLDRRSTTTPLRPSSRRPTCFMSVGPNPENGSTSRSMSPRPACIPRTCSTPQTVAEQFRSM